MSADTVLMVIEMNEAMKPKGPPGPPIDPATDFNSLLIVISITLVCALVCGLMWWYRGRDRTPRS